MPVCYPCGHTVDEHMAPSWRHKNVTFYFCSIDCEEEVKAEPAKWLAVAAMPASEQRKYAHGHGHHAAPAHDEHGHDHGHDHGHGLRLLRRFSTLLLLFAPAIRG